MLSAMKSRMEVCAKNAFQSALDLVSNCSNETVENLEKMYADEAPWDCQDELLEPEEDIDVDGDIDDNGFHGDDDAEVHIGNVLGQICDVAEKEYTETDMPAMQDPDMKLTDGTQLVELTASKTSADPAPSFDLNKLPKTLQEALVKEGTMFSNLWGLIVYLRCGPMGLDGAYLRNAEVVRNRSRKLNWHQQLGLDLAIVYTFKTHQHFVFFFQECHRTMQKVPCMAAFIQKSIL